jgi:spore coat polysaccharide biosynthesis protein SpsF
LKNIVAIIQARFNSSRLPGKVLKDLGGQTLLAWAVERARRARTLTNVVVATTTDPSDDVIVAYCAQHGYPVFRGSQFDVLDRFYRAALEFRADIIVRITADCPLIDPEEIDRVVERFQATGAEFACNRLPPPWTRTTPIGLDTEVCSFAGLERAWKEAVEKYEREHVMPFFYDVDGRFKVVVLDSEQDYSHLRWTVDTSEDLDLLRAVVARLGGRTDVSWRDVLALFEQEPELAQINANIQHKTGLEFDSRME